MDFETSSSIRLAYDQATNQLRYLHLKYGFAVAFVLILAGGVMDFAFYPDKAWPLFASRLICDAVLLVVALFIFRLPTGEKYSLQLSTILIACPSVMIAWMVYLADGVASPYYNGLLLMVVAACMLPLFAPKQFVVFAGFILLLYLAACFNNGHNLTTMGVGQFTNNLFFLVATSAMCFVMNYFDNRRRQRDFELQHRLEVALRQLHETQAQLIQNEKMSGLGSLAAGLLHEVNNPLNYATLACKTARSIRRDNEDLDEMLSDIEDGLDRIGQVISDLRAFAYPDQATHFEQFDLARSINTAIRFTSHLVDEIRVVCEIDDSTAAYGSSTLMTQVFVNVIANSAKALQNRVQIDKTFAGQGLIRIAAKPASPELNESGFEGTLISITDNGTGIPSEILTRVFDPFFTTGDVGEGTGLGLSVCHSIVKFHGGDISIKSSAGGTVFSIRLPAVESSAHAAGHQIFRA